jgi:hypothetical protein
VKVHYHLRIMPRFFSNWLRALRERRRTEMSFMCRHLLSERGEAFLTPARQHGRLYDSVATFHLSNGAGLERINTFGSLRPYGLDDCFGVTVNYRYLPDEPEENHERFIRGGIQVANKWRRVAESKAANHISFAAHPKKSVANPR